ncbi:MAG: dTDP-glucose 4,6-dehydratase [Candidatus Hydrogenedentota bacterium]
MKLLITGGCGFIGSHVVRQALAIGHDVTNLDKLTYAGNPANLSGVNTSKYRFVQGDIADAGVVDPLVAEADAVINLAAETHVDRSIDSADAFLRTNVIGVHVLCEVIKASGRAVRLLQVSTDEVYGSIDSGAFSEGDRFSPSSPYSAAKAGGELMAFSYHTTHGLDVVSTRGANTYGPNQFPEKLIPFAVTELLEGRKIPMYGDGTQVRDWLHVNDHARAILCVLENGKPGEAYNVPGENERQNIEVIREILKMMGLDESRIEKVKDRPGHDRRYAVDGAKLHDLGYGPVETLAKGLVETVAWYQKYESWWRPLKEASKDFFARHYGKLGRT